LRLRKEKPAKKVAGFLLKMDREKTKMKSLFVVATLVLSAVGALAQGKPLTASQIPLRADAPLLFAPSGWQIEKTISGDLNRDNRADAALVLVQKPTKNSEEGRRRALVVLLREGKGWRRAGFNGQILLGTRDGGAFYGVAQTPVNISIAKGVLVVNQDSGSREITETTHRFRYDARKRGFFLIGADIIERDRLSGEVRNSSINYLTGVNKTVTLGAESEKGTSKTSRVSRKLRAFESVTAEERYSP
jgi:hypothetical protein